MEQIIKNKYYLTTKRDLFHYLYVDLSLPCKYKDDRIETCLGDIFIEKEGLNDSKVRYSTISISLICKDFFENYEKLVWL